MIINIGNRTDIPAFYSEWFYRRLAAGCVCVRNPYNPAAVTRYRLDPDVVDCLVFCTKNPAPMFPRFSELAPYRQIWFVTVTPYGRDVEPYVPPVDRVLESFEELSRRVGRDSVIWRYDPVFLTDKYNRNFHLDAYEAMASRLRGLTHVSIISFIDLYRKTLRNFQGVREVDRDEQFLLTESFVNIAARYGMRLKTCAENPELGRCGADTRGCFTGHDLESIAGLRFRIPVKKSKREACSCLLENEIGAYNSCLHGCLYCYANSSREEVLRNHGYHNPDSPLLVGDLQPEDRIHRAGQRSYLDRQITLF